MTTTKAGHRSKYIVDRPGNPVSLASSTPANSLLILIQCEHLLTAKDRHEDISLFAQRGYAEVPTRDIAQACGIGERALYRHMACKEDLAVRVFRLAYLDFARQMSSVAPDSATLPEGLSAYLRVMLKSFDRDPALIRFLLIHQHETLAQAVRSEDVTPLTAVRGALERAQERGEIPTGDVDLQTAMTGKAALQPMTFVSHGRIPAPAMSQHPATLGGLLRCGSKART